MTAPESAPEASELPPERAFSRFYAPLLFLALACLILFNQLGRDASPEATRLYRRADQILDALRLTKADYALEKMRRSALLNAARGKTGENAEGEALELWRKLATSQDARPSDLRRYGIALAYYQRPGALETFRRIPRLPPPPPDPKESQRRKTPSLEPESALSPAQETTLWEAIYGKKPLRPAPLSDLRSQLAQLKLGWFEHLAAEALYRKAGRPLEAGLEAEAAQRSARTMLGFSTWQGSMFLLGLLAYVGVGIALLVKRSEKRSPASKPAAVPPPVGVPSGSIADFDLAPSPGTPITTAQLSDTPSSAPTPLPYLASVSAFVVYLALPLLIGMTLAPLLGMAKDWSFLAIWRFNATFYLLSNIGMVCGALYVLWRMSGKPPLRAMLATIGFQTRSFGGDIGIGLLGHAMTLPALALATFLSNQIFRNVETPPHPTILWMFGLTAPFDRALLFLQAAVVAAVVEEMVFRGILSPALQERWGKVPGMLLASAIFAALHPNMPGGFLPLFALGLTFNIVFNLRRSLLPGMAMHALNNFITVAAQFAVLSS